MKMAPTEPAGAANAISLGSDKRSEFWIEFIPVFLFVE
jgi:hypothetical protein